MKPRGLGFCFCLLMCFLLGASSVAGHANVVRSDPPANAILDQAPTFIRLWFTETLEPEFSHLILRDSTGIIIRTPPSQVDPADRTRIVLQPGFLSEGVYTVSWRVLSTDGHTTAGSLSFGIGVAVISVTNAATINETINAEHVAVRWLNFFSLSLLVGGIAFWLFAWMPAVPEALPTVERRMRQFIWISWVLVGISSLFILLLQTSVGAGIRLIDALNHPALGVMITSSIYGTIWIARLILWIGLGGVLWLAVKERSLYSVALLLSLLILLTVSLYSHASGTPYDRTATVAGDWLHLASTGVWVGGLAQFFNVAGITKRSVANLAPVFHRLVAHFSNYVRVAVFALLVSGIYAAWLQIGTVDALLTTAYGQTLIIKVMLIIPLLFIAGINLILTRQKLRLGHAIWLGRLRGLVGAESAVTIGVLVTVGVMTSLPTARVVSAERNVAAAQSASQFAEMQIEDDVMVHLDIMPGFTGTNTFVVSLFDRNQQILTDASRIRLRFDHLDENLGQSELQPTLQSDGTYTAEGVNLSIAGRWRIRATVQRPGAYDTVVDFNPTIQTPPPVPASRNSITPAMLSLLSLVAGLALLGIGGYFAARTANSWTSGVRWVGVAVLATGMLFLTTALTVLNQS